MFWLYEYYLFFDGSGVLFVGLIFIRIFGFVE